MKRMFLLALVLVPLLVQCQSAGLSKRESKKRIEFLKEIGNKYKYFQVFDDVLLVSNKNESIMMDMKGKILLRGNYDFIPQSNSPLIMVQKDSLAGFVDHRGRWVLPLEYDEVGECACHIGDLFDHDGIYTLCKNGKYGIIDSAGNIVEPFVHDDYVWMDRQGRLTVAQWSEKRDMESEYILLRDRKTKIGPYESIIPFTFTNSMMTFQSGGLFGCVDTNGKEIVPCRYKTGPVVLADDCVALEENGRWVLRVFTDNYTQYRDVPVQSEGISFPMWISQLSNDFFFCQQEDPEIQETRTGAIDRNGKIVIPFDHSDYYFEYGKYIILLGMENEATIYDKNGQFVKNYDEIQVNIDEDYVWFNLPIIAVREGSMWGLADNNFNQLLPYKYSSLAVIDSNRIAATLANGNNAIIDPKGNIIIEGPFNYINPIGDGIYHCFISNPDNYNEFLNGYIDRWGHSTLAREEMEKAQKWLKKRQYLREHGKQ